MTEFYMKNLIPNGNGAFWVVRFAKNTEQGANDLRDHLLAAGDWGDATHEEYDNFSSAVPALAGILNGEVWQRVDEVPEPAAEGVSEEDPAGSEESPE